MSTLSDDSNILKEISISRFASNEISNQFVTSKGIQLGSTVGQMYQAYGNDVTTNIVNNHNGKLANFVYNFKNGNKTGRIAFYAKFSDSDINNAIIYSITLSLN